VLWLKDFWSRFLTQTETKDPDHVGASAWGNDSIDNGIRFYSPGQKEQWKRAAARVAIRDQAEPTAIPCCLLAWFGLPLLWKSDTQQDRVGQPDQETRGDPTCQTQQRRTARLFVHAFLKHTISKYKMF
jgi:hypothetical protein